MDLVSIATGTYLGLFPPELLRCIADYQIPVVLISKEKVEHWINSPSAGAFQEQYFWYRDASYHRVLRLVEVWDRQDWPDDALRFETSSRTYLRVGVNPTTYRVENDPTYHLYSEEELEFRFGHQGFRIANLKSVAESLRRMYECPLVPL